MSNHNSTIVGNNGISCTEVIGDVQGSVNIMSNAENTIPQNGLMMESTHNPNQDVFPGVFTSMVGITIAQDGVGPSSLNTEGNVVTNVGSDSYDAASTSVIGSTSGSEDGQSSVVWTLGSPVAHHQDVISSCDGNDTSSNVISWQENSPVLVVDMRNLVVGVGSSREVCKNSDFDLQSV